MAIPCRRAEAAALDWSQVDLRTATWTQPGAITKNGDAHRLYLHPLALDILKTRHLAAGEPTTGLVFPGPVAGKQIATFSKLKAALDKQAGMTGWVFHDFRRSFATALGEARMNEAVADAVLNHRQSGTRAGVLGVYQLAQRWPEQVAAMKAWGKVLATAIKQPSAAPTDNVVQMTRHRA